MAHSALNTYILFSHSTFPAIIHGQVKLFSWNIKTNGENPLNRFYYLGKSEFQR